MSRIAKESCWNISWISIVIFIMAIFALSPIPASAQSLEETLAVLYGNPPQTLKRVDDRTVENRFGVQFSAVDPKNCVVQVKSELGINEFYFDNVIVDEIRKYWEDFGSGPALNYTFIGNPGDRVTCQGGGNICNDRAEFSAVGEETVKNLKDAVARLYPRLCRGTHRINPHAKKEAEAREEKLEKGHRERAEANKRAVESPEGKRAFEELETSVAIEQDANAKLLRDAFAAYILLRRCHEARQGYLAIYVSDAELQRARKAVKRIEEKFRSQIKSGLNIDRIWTASNRYADRWPVSAHSCQSVYGSLMQQYGRVAPEERRMKKDF